MMDGTWYLMRFNANPPKCHGSSPPPQITFWVDVRQRCLVEQRVWKYPKWRVSDAMPPLNYICNWKMQVPYRVQRHYLEQWRMKEAFFMKKKESLMSESAVAVLLNAGFSYSAPSIKSWFCISSSVHFWICAIILRLVSWNHWSIICKMPAANVRWMRLFSCVYSDVNWNVFRQAKKKCLYFSLIHWPSWIKLWTVNRTVCLRGEKSVEINFWWAWCKLMPYCCCC